MARLTEAALRDLARDMERRVARAKLEGITAGTLEFHKRAIEVIEKGSPGQGRTYKRGAKGRRARDRNGRYRRGKLVHRASRPGDPPATDTGRLKQSIAFRVHKGANPTGEVGTNVRYAKYLDPKPDAPRWRKVAPRPFLTRARTDHAADIRRAIERGVQRGLFR